MKIYKINADFERYDSCYIDYEACARNHKFGDDELLIDFDGTTQAANWWPRIIARNHENPLGTYIDKLSGDVIIMERQGISKLEQLLGQVEILPLECDFGDYWAINVMTVLECIDYEASVYKAFSTGSRNGHPRIMRFEKYAFLPSAVAGHHVFKIADMPQAAIFVDEVFVKAVEEQGITGFRFEPVWEGPEPTP